jgi:hypothetical protein
MDDVPFREREEKRETNRYDSTESGIAEKGKDDGTAAPRGMQQDHVPPGRTQGEMLVHADVYDRNLATKRVLAGELTSMGFSEAQARKILHIGRRDVAVRQNTSTPSRPVRRKK